jgi:hypothetical protein
MANYQSVQSVGNLNRESARSAREGEPQRVPAGSAVDLPLCRRYNRSDLCSSILDSGWT